MKYLYVLVNSTTGFYIEQTYVSMLSLRHVTPDAFISLLVDDKTANIQDNKFLELIKSLVDEYKVISLPSNMPAIAKSRFIKTSMREYISGDFLFIDSDTIWASPVDEKDFTFDIMGVLDGHVLFTQNTAKEKNSNYFKKMNCFPNSEIYINSGVIYSKDTPFSKYFFNRWHEKWEKTSKTGIYVDQPSLNHVLNKEIHLDKVLLPGEYNSQIINSWNFFFKAKIIHYFSSLSSKESLFHSPYLLHQSSFWEYFKKATDIQINNIINTPQTLFENNITIKNSNELLFEETKLYGFIKDLYIRKMTGKKSKFDFFEKLLTFISKKHYDS
jgi:hypothetical protein